MPLKLFPALLIASAFAVAQPQQAVLKISTADQQQVFKMGEPIPLDLSFSSAAVGRYQLEITSTERSCMEPDKFEVSPSIPDVDRSPYPGGCAGSILGSSKILSAEPTTLKLFLNEWVRFPQPGDYTVTLTSKRVRLANPSAPSRFSYLELRSNPLRLRLISAPSGWQQQVFQNAVAVLDKAPLKQPSELEADQKARVEALHALWFLGTPAATRELVRRMNGGNFDALCLTAVLSSPHADVAAAAMQEALTDPDHPIDQNFLSTYDSLIHRDRPYSDDWRKDRGALLAQLIAALPNKKGKALNVSLETAVNEAWNGAAVSQQTTKELTRLLLSMFDQLSPQQQSGLLQYRWDKLKTPALLPLLKKYAETYHDYPEMRAMDAYQSIELSGAALQHWYELDPAGARPQFIREITRPRPRFNARVLGILPDETLPEVDSSLAGNLQASDDFDGASNISSLIARFATPAILNDVLSKLDSQLGKWACAIQNPLLAYVLRVDPVAARPRIEKAVGAHGEGFSACNTSLFQDISEIHYDPVLEEIGLRALNDPDPQVAMTAATMLGNFGSPEVESALWERYAAWSKQWSGKKSEMTQMPSATPNQWQQVGLGQNLMNALATGTSWLADGRMLNDLAEITTVPQVQQQLETYRKMWSHPLSISCAHNGPSAELDCRIAQYEFHSLDSLKKKIKQFPRATGFELEVPPSQSPENAQTAKELRSFLQSEGMVLLRTETAR